MSFAVYFLEVTVHQAALSTLMYIGGGSRVPKGPCPLLNLKRFLQWKIT